MKDTNKFAFLDNILLGIILATLVVVPLFFLPFTLNILDLNKQFLFYILVALGFFVWLITIMLRRVFVLHKTALDIPIIILWLIILFSTLFSLDKQESFFGTGSVFNYSFLLHSAIIIFYFLLVQSLTSYTKVKKALLAVTSASILGVVFFLIFGTQGGLSLGGSTLRFNTASALNSLFTVSLIPAFLLSLGYLLDKSRSMQKQIFWFVTLLLTGALIFTSGFKSVMVITLLGLVLMLILAISKAKAVSYLWASVTFGLALVAIFLLFVSVPESLRPGYPPEVSLGRASSTNITKQAISQGAKSFLLGAGPGTFNQLFSLYRTNSFNSIDRFWTLRFEKPLSSAHTMVAEIGILGSLSMLLFIFMAVSFFVRRISNSRRMGDEHIDKKDPYLAATVFIVFLSLTFGLFLNNYDTVTWLFWWFFLAVTIILFQPRQTMFTSSHKMPLLDAPQYSLTLSFITVLFLVSFIAFGIHLGKLYSAELAFTKMTRSTSSSFEERIALLDSAVKKRPQFHPYRIAAARLALGEAQRLSALPNPDSQRVTQLFGLAVQEARVATTLSPKRVNTWQLLALMYIYAQPFEPQASKLAIDALQRAISLEPSNPFFYNQIGNAYAFQGEKTKAVESYEKAIVLKRDFVPSYTNLTSFYAAESDIPKAIYSLERGLDFGKDDPNYVLSLAQLYIERAAENDFNRAGSIAEAVLKGDAKNVFALSLLAKISEKKGEKQTALQYYNRILQVSPNNEEALSRLKELKPPPSPPPAPTPPSDE